MFFMIRRSRLLISLAAAVAMVGIGAVAAAPASAAGDFALHFTGPAVDSQNYVLTSGSTVLPKDFTFSVDVRWDGTPGYIIAVSRPTLDTPPTAGSGVALGLLNGTPVFALATSGGNRVLFSTNLLTSNVWTTISGSYDGQIVRLFVDGTIIETQDFGSMADVLTPSSSALIVGREFIASTDGNLVQRGFHGDIDNVVLSQGSDPASLTTLERYAFSEGTGSVTADSGSNAFAGTLSVANPPTWVQGAGREPSSESALPNTGNAVDELSFVAVVAMLVSLLGLGVIVRSRRRGAHSS